MRCKILKLFVLGFGLSLGGCVGALPLALSSAAGALTIVKDVIGIDVALTQDTPGKTKVGEVVP